MKAVRVHEHGGPEKLVYEEVEVGAPEAGQLRVRQHAVGLNFIDVYHRLGVFPLPTLPAVIGVEAAGVVVAVGDGVEGFSVGDRIVYAGAVGAYAQERVVPVARCVRLPDEISFEQAAAIFSKGLTAEFLARRVVDIKPGQSVLVHAAAGGMGSLLAQWLSSLGTTVYGTVGSQKKVAAAKAAGCIHVIDYSTENFVERINELTNNTGLDVVYDTIGKDTLTNSINVVKPRGMLISAGAASGPAPLIDPAVMMKRGSIFFAKPSVFDYTATREELVESAQALFAAVLSGAVKAAASQTYPLAEAGRAHADLQARKSTGSTVLLP